MNVELPALLRALATALRDGVRPQVHDEQARIQLAAVLDVLGKLEGMTDWSPQVLQEQADALQRGCDAFEACVARAGIALTTRAGARGEDLPPLAQAEARVQDLIDWLFTQPALPAPLRSELDALLRDTLRQQLRAERKRIPLTDFAAMSSGGGRPGDRPGD